MVFIPKEQIDLVTKQVDIVQLIQEYVHLKKSGQNFLGLCPFHQEKTPSFVVSAGKQNYNCYGCGAYGTALNFLMNLENYTFIEAVYKLAERAGVTLEVTKDSQQFQAQNELEECLNKSNQFYVNNLKKSQENSAVSKYLEERKVLQKQIDSFQVGYALPEWRSLQTHLQKNSLSNEIQERCGLIKKGEKGNFYDRMRNRVIFPIRNISGKLLGFAGRAIGDEKPKYLNPPETELYKKSSTFYGIYEAQESIRKKSQLIIVEGYLDVIRLSEQGWHEALATCGTALTNGHIGFIQQRLRPQNIFLLFDGDQAGIKAAEKSVKLFLANNQDSRVVLLPDGFDPDDYFKQYTPKDFQ
ncbi:MAG: DNA primase, partial [bacterium]